MYVVTFYSYKGGVGRTMALVNAAFTLASKGRKVLLVDFDLEAPGLETYCELSGAAEKLGLVDFVHAYLETGSAPDIRAYICECFKDGESGGSVWVLPAGRRDAQYPLRFASIDWLQLYREREGFLLFEDLRQQLEEFGAFDYAFVDSRTGHTDIRGICTRQLPNAVVLMFYPNEQNISGLSMTVKEIIDTEKQHPDRKIDLLFCPSNVPYIDDENDIKRLQLNRAARLLGYAKPAATIHNYQSLDLLEQKIFVLERPKTRLAQEYRSLARAIIKHNIKDREGAIHSLRDISRQYWSELEPEVRPGELMLVSRDEKFLRGLAKRVDEIQENHPGDPGIAWELVGIYRELGNIEGEYEALTLVIARDSHNVTARRMRAMNLWGRNRLQEAIADLQAVLSAATASPLDLSAAIRLWREIDRWGWVQALKDMSVLARMTPEDKLELIDDLTFSEEGVRWAVKILDDCQPVSARYSNLEVLVLIGAGEFRRAMAVSGGREEVISSPSIQDAFNYAIAEWAETRIVPTDLLARVLELSGAEKVLDTSANFHQCVGLVHALLGNIEKCRKSLERAREQLGPGYVFSCWRYLKVSRSEMLEDLAEMAKHVEQGQLMPPFASRAVA